MLRIARTRADWAAERQFAPSSSRPVLTYEWDERERVMVPDEVDVSRIGKTLSGKMQRVLQRSFGQDMPVQRSILDLWGWCKVRHVKPDRGTPEPLHHERGLICPRLIVEVVAYCNGTGEHGIEEAWLPELRSNYYRRLIRRAAILEDLEYEEARDFIAGALLRMDSKMTIWAAGAA
jgi:hypothetical protein